MHSNFSTEKLEPALAEDYPTTQYIGDSLTRLSYHIRSVATWDDGRPVLATDVDFTLKLMFCPGLPNETAQLEFDFIRALIPDPNDPRHFTLECRGQSLEYPQSSGEFFIVPEAAVDPKGLLRRFTLAELQRLPPNAPADSALVRVARQYQAFAPGALPGCGPYQLSAWEKDRYLTFRRKEKWWGSKIQPTPFVLQARPSQLDFVIIPDASTASLALQRGDLDVFPQVPAREFARLQNSSAARAKLAFYSVPSYDVVTAGFNTRRPALADALTRKALGRCFDTAGLIKATQLGAGQQTVGIISPLDRANYNDSLAPLPFDLTAAAAMLRQAGWRRESTADDAGLVRTKAQGELQRLRLVVRYRAEESTFATAALQFQAAAASIGVAVSLLPTEAGSFAATLKSGDFDMYVRTLKGNPFMFNYVPLYHSRALGQSNVTGFSTPASDRLIDAITRARTPKRKSQLLRRFQTMLQTEAPIIPLFFLPTRVAANRNLTGLHVNSLKPGFAITTVERSAVPSPTTTP
ncbi:ABC transporter substrate-binding protein [Hymenobacter arizonensis]|uniref:ABC transporter substrate-binding protein n=1 Tax=Hymenobacter arizonensis TaxID=1227077 RepID=UPI0015A52C10|nr:ABC transporter substrate-binding protein [Hymenobacter arizonensis]